MRRLLLASFAIMAACDGPTIPPKLIDDIYDFRLATTPPSVLRWPSGTHVRVHIEAVAGAREDVLSSTFARAAAEWNRHALYGEYELVRATSLSEADVVLRWSDEISPVDLTECTPFVSVAVTTFCLRDDDPSRLYVFPLQPPHEAAVSHVRIVVSVLGTQVSQPDRVGRLVAHELGHVLGMARHSLDPEDLMWGGELTRATLSVRDNATLQILYHTEPEIVP